MVMVRFRKRHDNLLFIRINIVLILFLYALLTLSFHSYFNNYFFLQIFLVSINYIKERIFFKLEDVVPIRTFKCGSVPTNSTNIVMLQSCTIDCQLLFCGYNIVINRRTTTCSCTLRI